MDRLVLAKRSFLSGILIGIGIVVYAAIPIKYIGAMLFSLALLTIVKCKLPLYTGRIGFFQDKKNTTIEYIIMIIFNCAGAWITMCTALCVQTEVILDQLQNIYISKYSQPYGVLFISGCLCGILMFIAVYCKNVIIIIFCIMTFMLSGYDHCIVDFAYLQFSPLEIDPFIKFGFVALGNSIGAIFARNLVHIIEEK